MFPCNYYHTYYPLTYLIEDNRLKITLVTDSMITFKRIAPAHNKIASAAT